MAPQPLRIAMIGTRGVPATYGGFETAVEEVGRRLAARGHTVTVYCRSRKGDPRPERYAGMQLVYFPAARRRSLETLSHTGLSVAHVLRHRGHDVALVFNAANSVFLPLLRLRQVPTATHVDGLEWRRGKWGPAGKKYYRSAESMAVRWSDALIADAKGIATYYIDEFGATTEQIAYGAPILRHSQMTRLEELGCEPRAYHLVVARFEPENHVDLAIEGYLRSSATHPLVVVGSTPYPAEYDTRVRELAARSDRVRLIGGVWDQDLLDVLYANSLTYVHGHSVGGTNPSLLRAMGAAAPVVAYDVSFNRDVLGPAGLLFRDADGLAAHLVAAEANSEEFAARGQVLQQRAASEYTWDAVAEQYEQLSLKLANGESQRGRFDGRRRSASQWD
ncbi:glycosyltransferase family 1 protein [Leekyejoonella antrihumi]|uniref:Glycosyltransferase family 1 protein n=2 Tax=Leekyejoonella antrihumi TaxID=1660198 RepID=A0A563DTB6_9MICO|nr:DUF1972 domain-containing protein [Leekyejoonella antrihumi]TWP33490.1 glycosyltransferase family 1 protein [Leekyejoonella antrihumi]